LTETPAHRNTETLSHLFRSLCFWITGLVLAPPFNRWLIFYQPAGKVVEIKRVLYGNVNWRQEPERFF